MKVLLLGAGASKAYEASGTDVRMPLARDFLQTFHKLPISANPWVLVGNVLHYARIHRNLSPEQLFAAEIDIEDLHSEVETRMLGELMKCQTLRQLNPEAIQLHSVYVQLSPSSRTTVSRFCMVAKSSYGKTNTVIRMP